MTTTSMRGNVLMLSGLFVVSFCGLLWLTSGEHRDAQPNHIATVEPAIQAVSQTTAATSRDSVADSQAAIGESTGFEAESPDDAAQLPVDEEVTDQLADNAAAPTAADAEPLQSIESATRALRADNDQRSRLAALNALLLQGRQSTVDPAITQALTKAATDSDPIIAAQANSVLAETGRVTH